MKIQCVHFDLDSVLYLPSDFLQSALMLSVRAMIQYGLKADHQEALDILLTIRNKGANAADHFDQLTYHFNGKYDPVIIAAGVEKYWDSKQSNMLCAPNAFFVLDLLARKYPLTIVTNGIPVKQAGKLIRLGLCNFFIEFHSRSGIGKKRIYATAQPSEMKPHPYLWQKAHQDLGFDYSRCLMIGDRFWADMLGAKRLGMTTIKINQGEHRNEPPDEALRRGLMAMEPQWKDDQATLLQLMRPDYVIDDLVELIAIIEQIEST